MTWNINGNNQQKTITLYKDGQAYTKTYEANTKLGVAVKDMCRAYGVGNAIVKADDDEIQENMANEELGSFETITITPKNSGA